MKFLLELTEVSLADDDLFVPLDLHQPPPPEPLVDGRDALDIHDIGFMNT